MKLQTFAALAALTLLPPALDAQNLRQGYVDWGVRGSDFPAAATQWNKGDKWTDDDNFFISRVRPKTRFRNTATQVNPLLDESNDKKLIFWVPINNQTNNALPDGVYDSEVFPMWSYITHYGNWSTHLVRVPGNFSDVAHRNGVPVSCIASIPYGYLNDSWRAALNTMVDEVGADKMADFLTYYGVDGIGYNSEFQDQNNVLVQNIIDFHTSLARTLRERNPISELIWYDGTSKDGIIAFDGGLGTHNADCWGYGDNVRTSLFFNYNWNNPSLIERTVRNAEHFGRTPLDLYCGINMQGREPHNNNPVIWPYLVDAPLSIGLWGAHSENMFYESRAEKGTDPDTRQRTYMLRMEKWFTSGSRNPVNDIPVNNSLKMSADNDDFFGMSKMMSARSALKWDLSDEPFITHFNLGNGKFFNLNGVRQHNSEWYNIGIQDYLPTWMWWFSGKFMGRETTDLVANGLNAEFVWDDAWLGGSLVRVNGSSANEYLHLFKTEFPLRSGDVITMRYKVVNGKAGMSLVLSAKGDEANPACALNLVDADNANGFWVEKSFIVGTDIPALDGKELAMVALRFENAKNLDLRLGEFSVVRPGAASATPAQPVITKAEILAAGSYGTDAKVIFEMPNNKEAGEVCYNSDVNVSMFKLYAQQEGCEPVLMGMTTSWAGLMFAVPTTEEAAGNMRVGVSALSIDRASESPIAWSDYMTFNDKYALNDDIAISAPVLNPGQAFSIAYTDPRHPAASWTLTDKEGNVVASAQGTQSLEVEEGLAQCGIYDLVVEGYVHADGVTPEASSRRLPAYVQISDPATGAMPAITALSVNDSDSPIELDDPDMARVNLKYEATPGHGTLSRGVKVGKAGFGHPYSSTGLGVDKSFSVSFWFRPDGFENSAVHLLNIRDKGDAWANNNWGWFWHTMNPDGTFADFTVRMRMGSNLNLKFANTRITPGIWHHLTYVFNRDTQKRVLCEFYLDGERQDVTSYFWGDEETEGEAPYTGRPYSWRDNNVIAIGGYLHKSGSVAGGIDDYMFWNKALTADEVRQAMAGFDPDELPDALGGYFDFESDPNPDHTFTSKGHSDFKAGTHDFLNTEVEGQGTLYWTAPEMCAGSPFISGKAFDVDSRVSLITSNARVEESELGSESGSATLSFPRGGDYEVGVRIENTYGSDSRTIHVKTVATGVEEIEAPAATALTAAPSPFESYLDVTAPAEGLYNVALYDMQGQRRVANAFNATAGQKMRIYPEVAPGYYIVAVEQNGRTIGSTKVVKR